jgi:hypothetical protein
MEQDPIKRFIVLVLLQAWGDSATELVIPPVSGVKTPIKYKVGRIWYDISPPPSDIMLDAVIELGRMAKLSKGVKAGEFSVAMSGTRMKWRLTVTGEDGTFVLTPAEQRPVDQAA